MPSIAIVLNGTSSVGKTSIAKAIQRLSATPVIHASLDTFTDMFEWSAILDPEVRKECHRIGVANFHATLPVLAASRFPLVVDHIFEQPAWLEACRDGLKERLLYLVGLHCPLTILEEREKARGDRRAGLARWQIERVHLDKLYDLEVETSTHTTDECAREIVNFVRKQNSAIQSP